MVICGFILEREEKNAIVRHNSKLKQHIRMRDLLALNDLID